MALRHRGVVPIIVDRENTTAKLPMKGLIKQPLLTSRPALNDLSNKKTIEEKKQDEKTAIKTVKPILKKTISAPSVFKIPEPKSLKEPETIADPDKNCRNDPQMVTEYINEIYAYLRELETQFPIKKRYLTGTGHQSTPRMREVLVNWLVEVHANFKASIETLHICVSIMDRYLQVNKNIGRETLQLVGASSLMIACKYEEVYIPENDDFVYICDEAFTRRQLLKMESEILKRLEFNLGRPVSINFLRRYSKIAQVSLDEHTLAKYILELALLEYNLCHIKPSILAAAACCLAMCVMQEVLYPVKVWNATLIHYTTYTVEDIAAVMTDLANMLLNAPTAKHQAVRSKYSTGKLNKISLHAKLSGRALKKIGETKKTPTAIIAKVKN